MGWFALATLAAATFLGSAIQTAFGFGFAILAAPLFLVVMDSTAAVPVLAALNLMASAIGAVSLWSIVSTRLLRFLCLGSIAGFPLGLAFYIRADITALKLTTGSVIIILALYMLVRERGYSVLTPCHPGQGIANKATQNSPSLVPATPPVLVGIASGFMAAAMAMPGPAAMLYFSALRLTKQDSRALSLALFTFSFASASVLHAISGSFSRDDCFVLAGLLPFVLLGALFGGVLARIIS